MVTLCFGEVKMRWKVVGWIGVVLMMILIDFSDKKNVVMVSSHSIFQYCYRMYTV